MKKTIRYTLRITAGALLLFTTLWLLANALISLKRDSIHQIVIREIKKQVQGDIRIGDLAPEYFRTFPNFSIQLSDVSVRDSSAEMHHPDFLTADKIYARIPFLSLLTGKPGIGKIIVEDCSIYLFTDECGGSNLHRKKNSSVKKHEHNVPDFSFINTRFTVNNKITNAYHDIQAHDIDCSTRRKGNTLVLKINIKSFVHGIGFNMSKGSYLKESSLNGNLTLFFFPGNNIEFKNANLQINKHPYKLDGDIFLNTDTLSYDLQIQSKNLKYNEGISLLTESLQQKLDSVDISKPIDVEATVSGQMAPKVIPEITTRFTVKDAEMKTSIGYFDHCTYSGSFTNYLNTHLPPGDENSRFMFNDVYVEWSGIRLTSRSIEVKNLIHPFLTCDLHSVFDLTHLNELTESSTIHFEKGMGNLNIHYQGSLISLDTVNPVANGTLSINNAAFTYLPRNLLFENCTGVVEFRNEDLIIPQLIATSGNTNLTMRGNVTHLMALININPEQLTMQWSVSTPDLHLSDFLSYVGPKSVSTNKSTRKNKLNKATENIDRLLRDGIAEVNIKADKLKYKNFTAGNVSASIRMLESKILLNDVKLNHAGGLIVMKGSLMHKNLSNHVHLESTVKNVDIPGLFRAFDDFGQNAITHTNMRGQMSAKINVSGALTNNAAIKENSIRGKVDFSIRNGELINFEPVVKIAAAAFKKRDFSHIRFSKLDDDLEINGTAISIDKMEIRSNVVILFIEGVYDTKKGTDMSIQVPVSNLSREEHDIMYTTGRAGVNVRLHAKTQEDGTLKVSWDPFNRAKKKRKIEE